jgi:hypothetical protein
MILSPPRYTHGDRVSFINNGKVITGTVYEIDRKYSFLCPEGISYDILSGYMLYRHVNESRLSLLKS